MKLIYKYSFRNNTDIFIWTSLFFNNTTKDNKIYLTDFQKNMYMMVIKKNLICNRHVISSS